MVEVTAKIVQGTGAISHENPGFVDRLEQFKGGPKNLAELIESAHKVSRASEDFRAQMEILNLMAQMII